jgi:hypothetical protein
MSGKPPHEDDDWIAAEAAFAAACEIQGPERFDALKKAGQLRYHAHQKLLSKLLELDVPGAGETIQKKAQGHIEGKNETAGPSGTIYLGLI